MKLLIELQILTTASTILWFSVLGGHRIILKLLGRHSWESIKPVTCYFCTHFWIGWFIMLAYAGAIGLSWREGIVFMMLNVIISKLMDDKFGYNTNLQEENKRLENEIKRLKRK